MRPALSPRPRRRLRRARTCVDTRAVNRGTIESLIAAGAFDQFGHRAQLLESLGQAIDIGAARTRDRSRGQETMFDMFGEAEVRIRR